MIDWTDSANDELKRYLGRHRERLAAPDFNTGHLVQLIRLKALEEANRRRSSQVTDEILRHILERVVRPEDLGSPIVSAREGSLPALKARPDPSDWVLLFFGVLLPLITFGIEATTHFCANVFFDPLPTFGHYLLVATVPIGNFVTWWTLRYGDVSKRSQFNHALTGASLGISFFYAILYLPLFPFAVIALIACGLGLLPLTPLLAFLATWSMRRKLAAVPGNRRALLWGSGAGFALSVLLFLPSVITAIALHMIASESPKSSERGLQILRAVGSEKQLLDACYRRNESWLSIVDIYLPGTIAKVGVAEARDAFFRVTGKPFNSQPRPGTTNFFFDSDRAQNNVGSVINGLSLVASRIEGTSDPSSATAYSEWTLVFNNRTAGQQEAKAQIALPPGAVVSRLTLWIAGVEQEAAFGDRAQTTAAYQAVVSQSRDPVLVTTSGQDRVLMQCFPVPPGGGEMKVRIGITAPLQLSNGERASVKLPYFIERNFEAGEKVHVVEFEGPPVEMSEAELADPTRNSIDLRREVHTAPLWVQDSLAPGDGVIVQRLQSQEIQPPSRLFVVLDPSSGMEKHRSDLVAALRSLKQVPITILLAGDPVEEVTATELGKRKFEGGHDNLPGLVRGMSLASGIQDAAVVWIHGPQPLLSANAERHLQEIAGTKCALIDVAASPAVNVVAPKLEEHRIGSVHMPRGGLLRDDLKRLFAEWSDRSIRNGFVRQRAAAPPEDGLPAQEHSASAILLLSAFEEVHRLLATHKPSDQRIAADLAKQYRLVTPVSGAVVLETKREYDAAGLDPNTVSAAAAVPEPSTWILISIGIVLVFFYSKRRVRPT